MSAPPLTWTPWAPLPGAPSYTAIGLREQLDGGQAFRWYPESDDTTWIGQWSHHLARLRLRPTPTVGAALRRDNPASPPPLPLEYSLPASFAETTLPALRHYLAIDDDRHDRIDAALPLATDPHLATCHALHPHLRILRQPFGETLLAFLCSATKQIPQIKQMLALLATRLGTPLDFSVSAFQNFSVSENALPTWPQLAAVSEADLRACQLGFRARYIKGTAEVLAAAPAWLEETAALPYAAAKMRLLTLPGVGEKIADCVLLFGLGHHEAFPVDTWMLKAMARRYGLEGWSPTQVAHFGRVHYGPTAGLAQQHLFAWERTQGGR
ncbi:DNA-3-methyladenine glycosylase family protein [Actomonas aquatica]|uniref:DNA-(apurinic or apyrimidinic site) lyase n=1 Tax=Actomonas aquatica TaxID=2866162 RepID=A0ABZ1C7S7_9BACT|nr:DNA glycosylase [Opitutus sp. WL0086]WRQ86589.1 DNA glycosylase [Opitutus sp. WL0086]